VLHIPLRHGYAVLEREGETPAPGEDIALPELRSGRFQVARIGDSPIALDGRPCAYLERVS